MSDNSVYVVGAGASKEANLPTGSELKEQIAQLLDIKLDDFLGVKLTSGDPVIWEALEIHSGNLRDIKPYLYAACHIRDAMPQAISIDNFIDDHRDDNEIALCGKLAIVRSILYAEKKSLLYFEKSRVSNIGFDSLKNTWYTPFFQLLTENCGKDDLKARFKSITLIIFNYDRCIEHFIYYGLQNYYKLSDVVAADLVKEIKIFHPYGDVGTLPWSDRNGAIDFGAKPTAQNLLDLTKKIKTFTEGTDPDSSEIGEIRKNMGAADRLVFLGFAFHELNLQLITPEHVGDKKASNINCFATTYGISESNKTFIDSHIMHFYTSHRNGCFLEMSDYKCFQFFKEFWRSLAF